MEKIMKLYQRKDSKGWNQKIRGFIFHSGSQIVKDEILGIPNTLSVNDEVETIFIIVKVLLGFFTVLTFVLKLQKQY